MPNYIKNRIEILGTKDQVKAVLNKFSTEFPSAPKKAFDDRLIYCNPQTGDFGWLEEKTGAFEERNKEIVTGIPDGFIQDFEEAWVRFPDFDKIIKMPESLNITSDGFLSPMDNQFSTYIKFKDHLDELRQFCQNNPEEKDRTVQNFILGVKNYIDFGYTSWYRWSIENWGTKWNSSECENLSENVFEFTTAWSGVPNLINLMSKEFPEVVFVYEYSDEDTGCNCGIGKYSDGEIEFKKLDNCSKDAYELAFKLRPDRAENYQLVGDTYEYIDDES
jgi:hypothetical protein